MSNQGSGWDWTFHYVLSRKILPSNLSSSPEIKFVKDSGNNVTGFEIKASTVGDEVPEEYCNGIARKVAQMLAAKSVTTITEHLSGYEGLPKTPGRLGRTVKTAAIIYNIEGAPIKIEGLDLKDIGIQGLMTSANSSNNLEYLGNAISHLNADRPADSIKEGFKVIEEYKSIPNYLKYKCIRDIVSHQEDKKSGWWTNTSTNFGKYFGPTFFDFKKPYDPTKGIIVLDLESPKTKQTLKQVAEDLVNEAKTILHL